MIDSIVDLKDLTDLIGSGDKVVVKFTAPAWCGPCRAFAPHYESASEKSEAKFVAVDVDNAPWAMQEYGVQAVPTVMLFEDGELVKRLQERTVVKLLQEIE